MKTIKPVVWGALGGLILLTVKGATMEPRGIRNNNPGNLRKNGIQWKGLLPADQQTDSAFYKFIEAKWGIRAMARDLTTDYTRDGQRTIRSLINEYAPGSENNTSAYINAVSQETGIGPDQRLILIDDLPDLVAAIIRHENGRQPYSMDYIREAIALA